MTTDLAGRSFLVTGANTGIGRVTALELARRGGTVILACRSRDKTDPVIKDIVAQTKNDKVSFLALDLSSLASVKAAAADVVAKDIVVDVLVNNAGVAGVRGVTTDGFELAFGTNHLGHHLFTKLLLPRLLARPAPRIVNVASESHYMAKQGIDFSALKTSTPSVTGMPSTRSRSSETSCTRSGCTACTPKTACRRRRCTPASSRATSGSAACRAPSPSSSASS